MRTRCAQSGLGATPVEALLAASTTASAQISFTPRFFCLAWRLCARTRACCFEALIGQQFHAAAAAAAVAVAKTSIGMKQRVIHACEWEMGTVEDMSKPRQLKPFFYNINAATESYRRTYGCLCYSSRFLVL